MSSLKEDQLIHMKYYNCVSYKLKHIIMTIDDSNIKEVKNIIIKIINLDIECVV